MFVSRKVLITTILAITLNLCLSVCSMPQQTVRQTAKSDHCHTEQPSPQQNEQPDADAKHCCDRDSVLRTSTIVALYADDSELSIVTTELPRTESARLIHRFSQNYSPPLIATVLRI